MTDAAPTDASRRIVVLTDASSDVPSPERAPGWVVLPDRWQSGDLVVDDHGDLRRDLARIALSDEPLDATAPTPARFERAFADAVAAGAQRIYALLPASVLTPAIDAAREAATSFPQVLVVETNAAGIGTGLLARRLRARADEGVGIGELDAWLDAASRSIRFIVVPDRFDPQGGQRLSAAILLAGKPSLLAAAAGHDLSQGRRLRSRRSTVTEIERYLDEHAASGGTFPIAVGHGDAPGAVDPLMDIVERHRPDAQVDLVGRIGPRIIRRIGVRCVGLAWLGEPS